MSESDNVISIGSDFRNYSRRFWGSADRERAALTEPKSSDREWILPGSRDLAPDHVMAWNLHGHTKQDEARRQRLELIRLEEKNGLRPRSWF